jgi:hypothetical protein
VALCSFRLLEGKSTSTNVDSVVRSVALLLLAPLMPGRSNWTGFGFDAWGTEMQRIREALRLEVGMTIVDVGAGKGEPSSALASEVGPRGTVFATDFPSPFFLSRGEFGVPAKVDIGEVTSSGFELLSPIDDWPDRGPLGSYCVLFRKPL